VEVSQSTPMIVPVSRTSVRRGLAMRPSSLGDLGASMAQAGLIQRGPSGGGDTEYPSVPDSLANPCSSSYSGGPAQALYGTGSCRSTSTFRSATVSVKHRGGAVRIRRLVVPAWLETASAGWTRKISFAAFPGQSWAAQSCTRIGVNAERTPKRTARRRGSRRFTRFAFFPARFQIDSSARGVSPCGTVSERGKSTHGRSGHLSL